jgi:nickel-dependent lactate racemase
MRVGIDYGNEHVEVELREDALVGVHRHTPAPPLTDPAAAIQDALEAPLGFPALRRALTPDDHIAIVIDPHLPHLALLLSPVLEQVVKAGVAAEAITLVCPPSGTPRLSPGDLPAVFRKLAIETHDPANRKQISYLATTRQGRRIYLNRTVVDADQVVVLARCKYDPLLGYAGAEGAIYPALSDEATRQEMCGRLSLAAPEAAPWVVRQEAMEVAWLLGTPFMVQIVEGPGDKILHVVSGMADSVAEGQRLLDARWRVTVNEAADTVVASISGDPAQQDFGDLASALACAARVVKPEGQIVLLSRTQPALGPGAKLLRQAEDPGRALSLLAEHVPGDLVAAFQWASSAQRARIYLLSGLPPETAEELFTTPLDNAGQVQRLLNAEGSCLFLADAHRTLAVLRQPG